MLINDPVYGKARIDEPVLIDLIRSPSMQRLKKIQQFGLPKQLYSFPGFTRFEHCVGVMLLLRRLNAPLEEQIAGLLHDVSHSAFSHLIDWVWGDPEKEDYQDKVHKKFIKSSEIPQILAKYNMDYRRVTRLKAYPLLEQKAPELCADRVDYGLRELYYWANPKLVKPLLKNLAVFKQKIVFKNKSSALSFAQNFLNLQTKHWGSKETILRYYLFSLILKDALREKIISESDLKIDDKFVLAKLKSSKNAKVQNLLKILKGSLDFNINPKLPTITLRKKFRFVDPLFINREGVKRLSKVNKQFKALLEKEKASSKLGIKFNLISSS